MTDQENQIVAETVGKMFVKEYKYNGGHKMQLIPTQEELETKIFRYVFDNADFMTVGQVELMIKFVETKIVTSIIRGGHLVAINEPITEFDENDHGVQQ